MPTKTYTENINELKFYSWNNTKLKYSGVIRGRIGFRGYNVEDTVDEGTDGAAIVLGGTNVMKDGKISYEKLTYLSERKYLESPEIMLKGGEILITKVGAGTGENALYSYYQDRVTINPNVMLFIADAKTFPKFINYLLLNDQIKKEIAIEATKSGAQPAINQNYIENLKLNLPPKQEQQAIADFLDNKCEKIDKVIGEIEEQVQILEDYKKSLITETVTKGLDRTVPMKDSGIDWIGKIPKNWNIKRIKYFTTLNGRIGWQGLTTEDYKEEGPFLITGTDFMNGKINWDTCTHITEKRWIEANTIQIRNNDLLITKDGTVGKIAIVEDLKDKASLNSGVLLIRPNKNVKYNNKFMYYQLLSDVFWSWFEFNKSGNSTIIHLYQQDFENLYVLLPEIQEQEQIANYLDKKCAEINYLIKNKKEQLETIKEYKKSLIYEYVTGKKRVAF